MNFSASFPEVFSLFIVQNTFNMLFLVIRKHQNETFNYIVYVEEELLQNVFFKASHCGSLN